MTNQQAEIRNRESGTDRLLGDPGWPRLKEYLIDSTGMYYFNDKDAELARQVRPRLSPSGARDCTSYLALLRDGTAGEAELDELIGELTIGETFFFRHQEQFDALREIVLPEIIKRKGDRGQLRVWSAGCALGAEPYSVSILLQRDLASLLAGWEIFILGTDINRKFLAAAQRGQFRDWTLRSSPDAFKQSCFTGSSDSWTIRDRYRKGVTFQYHNLVKHPFPSMVTSLFAFDIIFCRNVTMYFHSEVRSKILAQLRECLVDGGWLLVGPSEPDIRSFRIFRTVIAPGATLYQRRDDFEADRAGVPAEPAPAPTLAPTPAPVRTEDWLANLPLLDSTPPVWPAEAPREPEVLRKRPKPAEPVSPELAEIVRLADRGESQGAARACDALLQKDRLNVRAHFYQALVLEQVGSQAESEQALRRALYLDRNLVLAHYHLGLLLQKKGDLKGAARSFRNAGRLLSAMDDGQTFAEGDGISVADLKELAEMQLEVVKGF